MHYSFNVFLRDLRGKVGQSSLLSFAMRGKPSWFEEIVQEGEKKERKVEEEPRAQVEEKKTEQEEKTHTSIWKRHPKMAMKSEETIKTNIEKLAIYHY